MQVKKTTATTQADHAKICSKYRAKPSATVHGSRAALEADNIARNQGASDEDLCSQNICETKNLAMLQ